MEQKHAVNAKYNSEEWIGKRYGKLTVIGYEKHARKNGEKSWYWKARCDCGNEKLMSPYAIISGKYVSCGCVRFSIGHDNYKHGETGTRLHTIWGRMIERCSSKDERYKRYSGRGIGVCEEWHNYETFAEWARNSGYQDNLSIERIDNDGNYCPENCKWIEQKYQARNRGTTFWVDYCGKKMSLAEACELADMPYKTVFTRIKYMGWSVDDALSIPLNTTRKWKRSERFCKQAVGS